MICTEAEVRASLGLAPTISDAMTARLILAVAMGHASVRNHLQYEPEQRAYTNQIYPRSESGSLQTIEGVWDVDSSRRRAVWQARNGIFDYLQLENLPVREVTEVRVDPSARYGQQSGDFGTGTIWTKGEQFYEEQESEYLNRTGMLIAVGAWPVQTGTVRVSYRAGYSPAEFAGQAAVTNTNDNGYITTAGCDASGLKQATLLESMRAYLTFKAMSLNPLTGVHVAGPLSSERLGDYSYSLASGQAAALLTSMQITISPQAAMLLEPFMNWGIMLV